MKQLMVFLLIIGVAASAFEYQVQSGDTVSGLAKRFCCTTAEIVQLSKLSDANKIRVGQKLQIPDLDIERLISAFEYVESRKKQNAIGDGGKAVGILQIWTIMVAEANRCHKIRFGHQGDYTLDDRNDAQRSEQMFRDVMIGRKVQTVDQAVKIWNPKADPAPYRQAYLERR